MSAIRFENSKDAVTQGALTALCIGVMGAALYVSYKAAEVGGGAIVTSSKAVGGFAKKIFTKKEKTE